MSKKSLAKKSDKGTAVVKTPDARVPEIIRRAPVIPYDQAMIGANVDVSRFIGPTGEGWEEAPSALYDMVDFSDMEPPAYVDGIFDSVRVLHLGDRVQRIYELLDANGERFGVWGSTVIDDRMNRLNPDRGSMLLMVFVGETKPKPGQNPARIFRIFARKPATEPKAVTT